MSEASPHTVPLGESPAAETVRGQSWRQRVGQHWDTWYLTVVCVATLTMVAWTWGLWLNQTQFPQVPLIRWALSWPRGLDHAAAISLLVGCALMPFLAWLGKARLARGLLLLMIGALLILWCGDQHRLQPWAYQFAIVAWWLAVATGDRRPGWLRAFLISLYLYSAFSKFDYTFVHSTGQLIVQAAANLVGVTLDQRWLTRLAWVLPSFELLVGLTLISRRLWPLGIALAGCMHVGLILLLGPLGLNHRLPVLVWNASCLLQVVLLFGFARSGEQAVARRLPRSIRVTSRPNAARWRQRLAALPLAAAIVLPLFEPFGRWDPWLAWGLYSHRFAKIEVWVARPAITSLPTVVQPYCVPAGDGNLWVRCAIDRWSLEALGVPLYPHHRFYLGVARAVIDSTDDADMITLAHRSLPNRWSGETQETRQGQGRNDVFNERSFFWNAQPRDWTP